MRKQKRPDAPKVFAENSVKWGTQWKERREADPRASFTWYSVGGKSAREWALPILRSMNQGHCSFCDTYPLQGVSEEPIEHFKPKSLPDFYEDAFAWENLYYICDVCNHQKGERWDERLIRPDAEGYIFLRYFEFDYTTGAIRPSQLADEKIQQAAQVTIDFYGLDLQSRRTNRLEAVKRDALDIDMDCHSYRDFFEGIGSGGTPRS